MWLRKLFILFVLFLNSIFSQQATEKCNDSNNLDYEKYPNYGRDWLYFCTEEGNAKVIFIDPTKDPNQTPDISQPVFNILEASALILDHNVTQATHFYIYNKDNRRNGTKIDPSLPGIGKSTLNRTKRTVFLIHGFMGSYLVDHVQELKNAYLVYNDYNIIIVDWGAIAKIQFYPIPMVATKHVGNYIAKFIDSMIALSFDPDKIHIVGHSLGAHVSGFAGQQVTRGKLGRVTGLDPALPGYLTGLLTGGKISKDSAKFVDIIHTCGGLYGITEPLGHVDFYPNNGVSPQPGCGTDYLTGSGCSHARSWQYFKESINNPKIFQSLGCSSFSDFLKEACGNDTILMGEPVLFTARGNFYLTTNPNPPFGKGILY